MSKTVTAPEGLSEAVTQWWAAVVAEFDLEPHHHKLLAMAAEALDTWHTAHQAIQRHGLTYTDRFDAPRQRPEVGILRDSRIAFARLVRELNLDADAPEPPRPAPIAGRYERTK